MKRVDFRRVFIVTGLAALGILYAVLWVRMIATPAERTGSDFIAFFAAGRVARLDGSSRVYDPALQQSAQQEQVGFQLAPGQVLLYNHLPYLIPILSVLVDENYVSSFLRWTVLLVALYAASAVLLVRLVSPGGRADLLLAAGILTFYPLFVSLMNGQDTAFAALGLCLWLFGLLTGRDWLAGLGLVLVTVRPQIALILAVPFLFRRQKVFGWFCAGAVLLGLVSFLAVGPQGIKSFLQLLSTTAGGEWYGVKEPAMVNLIGLLWRATSGLGAGTIHLVGWAAFGVALVSLCLLWGFSREIGPKQVGLAVILALFVSPHLHYHDLTLLLVPLAAAILSLVGGGFLRRQGAGLLPLAISLALLFGSLLPVLKYNLPYLVMLSLALAIWMPAKLFFWKQ